MALQLASLTRNAKLDALETEIGTDPVLTLRTGAPPVDCAAADSGSVLATLALPTDWMAAASSGAKAMAGAWTGTASASGTAAHFRIYTSLGVCKLQGTVGLLSGDLALDDVNLTPGKHVAISAFTLTEANG